MNEPDYKNPGLELLWLKIERTEIFPYTRGIIPPQYLALYIKVYFCILKMS